MKALLTIAFVLRGWCARLWRYFTQPSADAVERADAILKAKARQAANAGFGGRRG